MLMIRLPLLLEFICTGRLPLSCVESEQFQALIRELNPGIYDYMWKSGNTVKAMLLAEFDRGKEILKLAFKDALSKVHISFDLWTSPNKLAMLGVVAHYLAPDLTAKSPLIALRKLLGNHSGENQGKILLEVAEEFDLSKEKLGYFISDNDSRNDLAVRFIAKEMDLGDPEVLRLRCIGHIINLACEAFLGAKEDEYATPKSARLGLASR